MASMISLGQLFDRTITTVEKNVGHFIGIVTWALVAALPAALAEIFAMYGQIGSVSLADYIAIALKLTSGVLSLLFTLYITARLLTANAEINGEPVKDDHSAAWKHLWPLFVLYVVSGLIMFGLSLAPLSAIALFILQSSGLIGASALIGVLATVLLVPGGVAAGVGVAMFLSATTSARLRVVLENEAPLTALKASLKDSRGARLMTAIRYYLPRLVYGAVVYIINAAALFLLQYTALILASVGIPAGFAVGLQNGLKLLIIVATSLISFTLLATNDYLLARSLKPRR